MKKVLPFLLFICVFFIMLVGCNNNVSSPKSTNYTSIYLLQNDEIIPIIKDYNRINSNKQIKITQFENMDTLNIKLTSEIMSGAGPDLISYNRFTNNQNIRKFINSNAFADLNELINNDQSKDKLILDNYNQVVINSGVYNGKRLFFPLTYSVEALVTSKENCEKYNIVDNGLFSFDQIDKKFEKFLKEQNRNKDMYAAYPTKLFFKKMLSDYIDFNKGTFNFKTEEFKNQFLSIEKTYKNFNSGDSFDPLIQIAKGNILFIEGYFCGNPYVSVQEAKEFFELGATPVIQTLSHDKNSYSGIVSSFLAINNNSTQKEEALNFIKFTLSEKKQLKVETNELPVNNKAYDSYIKKANNFIKTEFHEEDKNNVVDFLNNYQQMIENVNSCNFDDFYYMENIFIPCLNEYLDKTVNYNTFLNRLTNRTKIYLEE